MSADAAERRGGPEQADATGHRDAGSAAPTSKGPRDLPRMVAPEPLVLVPEGGVFEGEVALSADTRIEGCVQGRLRGPGRVVVGPGGRIEGSIECEALESEGAIFGPVVAWGRVRLGPGARLEGDLCTDLLEVADSALWNGLARVGTDGSDDAGSAG